MKTEQPSDNTLPPHKHPLYRAFKQLAEDLRTLFELASREDEKSWNNYISLAKEEIEATLSQPHEEQDEMLLYKALIQDVYNHLTMLVNTMKSSQERYKRLATRDMLTGVYNRNYFNETIVRDIERAKRYGERLSFILIDVNGFKRINDTYGHLHGDGVLRACAEILRSSVRKADFLCRYGGDEFVIVTPEPTCRSNATLFERIAENTRTWNSKYATLDYQLSFSIGCAAWEQGMDILQVLHEADLEMYKNKKKNSNR